MTFTLGLVTGTLGTAVLLWVGWATYCTRSWMRTGLGPIEAFRRSIGASE